MGKETWPRFYRTPYLDNGSPFRGARLKVMRAEHHLEELEIAARVLPNDMAQKFVIAVKDDTIRLTFLPERMPLQLSAALGDCIHNLRSAFDHVAVAMTAPPIGSGDPDKASLPTGADKEDYKRNRRDKMRGAPGRALDIIDALEPWGGGKHLLRELHDLDVRDKHKLLVPAIAEMKIRSLQAEYRGSPIEITGKDIRSVADGQNFIAEVKRPGAASADDFRFTGPLTADFEIKFGRNHPCAGMLVIPTLVGMRDAAARLLDECESTFPGYVSWTNARA